MMNLSNRVPAGGTAWVKMGVDGRFDKPCYILEGIDLRESRASSAIQGNFGNAGLDVERVLINNGYDVVYLTYNQSRIDIRSNAAVFEELIMWVNNKKIGNELGMVIGESMGGVIARYCLRSMERRGLNHKINTFISFDTPHLGANVNPGVAELVYDIDETNIRDLLGISQSKIDQHKASYESVAAKQMLLRYRGGSPHPYHVDLQDELQRMGWPQWNNMKRYALASGDVNGSRQNTNTTFAPGDNFARAYVHLALPLWFPPYVYYFRAQGDIWTNELNKKHQVSKLTVTNNGIPTTIKRGEFNFDQFNYDLAPGGYFANDGSEVLNSEGEWYDPEQIMKDLGMIVFRDFDRPNVCFIPTFSAWAVTNLSSYSHLFRSASTIKANNWTPFHKIYGTDGNTSHVDGITDENKRMWKDFLEDIGLFNKVVPKEYPQLPRFIPPSGLSSHNYFLETDRGTRSGRYMFPDGNLPGVYRHNAGEEVGTFTGRIAFTNISGPNPGFTYRPTGLVGSSTYKFSTYYGGTTNSDPHSARTYVFTINPVYSDEPDNPFLPYLRLAADEERKENIKEAYGFPNPAGDRISLKIPSNNIQGNESYKISFFDLTGTKALEINQNSLENLDISTLSVGLYKVKIASEISQYYLSIIKQ
jgi:hypothetical protein